MCCYNNVQSVVKTVIDLKSNEYHYRFDLLKQMNRHDMTQVAIRIDIGKVRKSL